jgi:hypothetical protein
VAIEQVHLYRRVAEGLSRGLVGGFVIVVPVERRE